MSAGVISPLVGPSQGSRPEYYDFDLLDSIDMLAAWRRALSPDAISLYAAPPTQGEEDRRRRPASA